MTSFRIELISSYLSYLYEKGYDKIQVKPKDCEMLHSLLAPFSSQTEFLPQEILWLPITPASLDIFHPHRVMGVTHFEGNLMFPFICLKEESDVDP